MCTALSFTVDGHHYFGRNFDYERSYGEEVVISPANDPINFYQMPTLEHHYPLLGIAAVFDGTPLFFDAMNDQGLAMAGLNYPDDAYYRDSIAGKDNIASYEIIPWVLGQCSSIQEVKQLLAKVNITNHAFSAQLEPATLHWIITDRQTSVVLESDQDGIHVYDNPVSVLTNNPSFPKQLFNLNNYRALSANNPANTFNSQVPLLDYSRGLGTHNLPGGMDSASRFVRATFTKYNTVWAKTDELSNVTELFHIMHSVEQQSGSDQVADNPANFEYTIYTVGYNLDQGQLYNTTYTNNQINHVDLNKIDAQGDQMITYPFVEEQAINQIN